MMRKGASVSSGVAGAAVSCCFERGPQVGARLVRVEIGAVPLDESFQVSYSY